MTASSTPPRFGPPPPSTFAVSREQFDSVPRRRATYIIAYMLVILLFYGPRVALILGATFSDPIAYTFFGMGVLSYLIFCYQFIGALKIMGYEPWMMLALGIIAAIPIPGVIIVGYMDRRIATAWDRADPARASYRQKPAPRED